ncbi:hypothetical protein GCM10022237_25660 [Nocardioides ginsengisoli]|uniref:ParB/RepB/Spo0J family partition protein n=1 Tax=Nocardioides ginsengisoli TaxID=363868 RepID=A0ABW3W748_9ACTN
MSADVKVESNLTELAGRRSTGKTTKAKSPAPTAPPADTVESTDVLVQATSGALAVLEIDLVRPHPKNIRHNAVADDELVESIRANGLLQPLVVAPVPGAELGNDPGPAYRLIAGHRRLDGLKKAGASHATVIIRRDLTDEADQVAAMLVENCRRADLTPMEEAERYGQLRFDYGWKPGEIAKAAGHTVDTVNKRLRLLKLNDKVRKTVDQGELTLDDALSITNLPAAEQTKLAKYAGTSSFKWELSRTKEKLAARAKADKLVAELEQQGVPKRDMPKGRGQTWGLNHADHGMTALGQTFSRDRASHDGCLAYVITKDHRGADEVEFVCTNVPAHDEQLDEERRQRRLEEEREQREAAERREAYKIAENLRADTVMSSIRPGIKIDPALLAVITLVVPGLVANLGTLEYDRYADAYGIPEEQRWRSGVYQFRDQDLERYRAHADAITTGPPKNAIRALAAYLVARIEQGPIDGIRYVDVDKPARSDRARLPEAVAWFQLVAAAGHDLTPVDIELRDKAIALVAGTTEADQ